LQNDPATAHQAHTPGIAGRSSALPAHPGRRVLYTREFTSEDGRTGAIAIWNIHRPHAEADRQPGRGSLTWAGIRGTAHSPVERVSLGEFLVAGARGGNGEEPTEQVAVAFTPRGESVENRLMQSTPQARFGPFHEPPVRGRDLHSEAGWQRPPPHPLVSANDRSEHFPVVHTRHPIALQMGLRWRDQRLDQGPQLIRQEP
jgi:hypothetical protein